VHNVLAALYTPQVCLIRSCCVSSAAAVGAAAGTSALAASLSAQQARLAGLEAQLAQAEALGDDAERAALQKRVELIARADILPGGTGVGGAGVAMGVGVALGVGRGGVRSGGECWSVWHCSDVLAWIVETGKRGMSRQQGLGTSIFEPQHLLLVSAAALQRRVELINRADILPGGVLQLHVSGVSEGEGWGAEWGGWEGHGREGSSARVRARGECWSVWHCGDVLAGLCGQIRAA
jgi:hypothetical protein